MSHDPGFDAGFSYTKNAQKINCPPQQQQYQSSCIANPLCTSLYAYKTAPKVGNYAF